MLTLTSFRAAPLPSRHTRSHCFDHDSMPQINGMPVKLKRNLHVPLPAPAHERLRAESARSGKPATTLAREAIEAWLEDRERQAVHDAITEYAVDMAGTGADLDRDLERAAAAQLAPRRRRKK